MQFSYLCLCKWCLVLGIEHLNFAGQAGSGFFNDGFCLGDRLDDVSIATLDHIDRDRALAVNPGVAGPILESSLNSGNVFNGDHCISAGFQGQVENIAGFFYNAWNLDREPSFAGIDAPGRYQTIVARQGGD